MSSANPQRYFPLIHRSIKIRFAYRFLRALKKLNKPTKAAASNVNTDRTRRYHMVKTAAYASMAKAVGSRRAWSRALLWKIRNKGLSRTHAVGKRSKAGRGSILSLKNTRSMEENPSKGKAGELKKLVPGGEVMDMCGLLDETAHYIKCLTSQVEIMRSIVQFYSA